MTISQQLGTAASPPSGPPAVSRFEYNLLRILRFLVGQMPADQAMNLVYAKLPVPPCLSRVCVQIAQDTLAKASVLHLAQAGGWRNDRFLVGRQPVAGRVWERLPLEDRTLRFGPGPLAFLLWLTAEKPTDSADKWDVHGSMSPADELFFLMAYDQLKAEPEVAQALVAKRCFRDNPLVRLAYAGDFAAPETPAAPDFSGCFSGTRAAILECLQPVLAQRWIRSERAKGQIGDWKRMRQQGSVELETLRAYLKAADEARRPDLTRFVLAANAALLAPPELGLGFWTGGLQGQGPARLADRIETQRAALAFPRQLETLQSWERQARAVGYYEEDYPTSQLWKADWEQAQGDAVAAKARALIERLDPLRTG